MEKSVLIPWSSDPEVNRKNIEDAINSGDTEINGEYLDGKPRPYPINFRPVPEEDLPLLRLLCRSSDRGH